MPNIIDLSGQRFGRLTAVRFTRIERTAENRSTYWLWRCDCGREVELKVRHVKYGNTLSCGCLQDELRRALIETHSKSDANKVRMSRLGQTHRKHGMSRTAVYKRWRNMLARCDNENFPFWRYYGERGITVCERWRKFENFYADMGDPPPGMSIDRIDNDGNYEPGNCRWATWKEQRANQRR